MVMVARPSSVIKWPLLAVIIHKEGMESGIRVNYSVHMSISK
jgi:hypothetical protein